MAIANKDIGAEINEKQAISIQNVDASTDVNGTTVDRAPDTGDQSYHSAVAVAQTGSATGSPTDQTHVFKLQESTDDSTWTDVSGKTITIEADDTLTSLDLDLTTLDRYVRLTYDSSNSSFTGGTSPTNDIAAQIILGGPALVPHG